MTPGSRGRAGRDLPEVRTSKRSRPCLCSGAGIPAPGPGGHTEKSSPVDRGQGVKVCMLLVGSSSLLSGLPAAALWVERDSACMALGPRRYVLVAPEDVNSQWETGPSDL